jgi:CDP-glycerol glycerophosphotransferase (TagB/SpsB family)
MQKISLNLPLNKVSFGVVSTALLREFYSHQEFPNLFPISQVDLSAQKPLKLFESYVNSIIQNSYKNHSKDNKVLKLWHLNGSLECPISNNKKYLVTFHETDQITPFELNVINNYDKVIVTSQYTKQVFEEYGARNIEYVDLGFDSNNFWKTPNFTNAQLKEIQKTFTTEFKDKVVWHQKVIEDVS